MMNNKEKCLREYIILCCAYFLLLVPVPVLTPSDQSFLGSLTVRTVRIITRVIVRPNITDYVELFLTELEKTHPPTTSDIKKTVFFKRYAEMSNFF